MKNQLELLDSSVVQSWIQEYKHINKEVYDKLSAYRKSLTFLAGITETGNIPAQTLPVAISLSPSNETMSLTSNIQTRSGAFLKLFADFFNATSRQYNLPEPFYYSEGLVEAANC